jgi:hypothetical protein
MDTNGTNKVALKFTDPRNSDTFEASVAPECTAEIALAGLMAPNATPKGPFLQPPPSGRPYELVLTRTSQALSPNTTMGAAGVESGDVLEVRQSGQGA